MMKQSDDDDFDPPETQGYFVNLDNVDLSFLDDKKWNDTFNKSIEEIYGNYRIY